MMQHLLLTANAGYLNDHPSNCTGRPACLLQIFSTLLSVEPDDQGAMYLIRVLLSPHRITFDEMCFGCLHVELAVTACDTGHCVDPCTDGGRSGTQTCMWGRLPQLFRKSMGETFPGEATFHLKQVFHFNCRDTINYPLLNF